MLSIRSVGRYIPMITVMGMLFCLSQVPGDAINIPLDMGLDKLLHGAAYALLALTVMYGRYDTNRGAPLRTGAAALIICLFYGLLDEWHQSFVPGRDASGLDLLADGGGALLAIVVWLFWMRRGTGSQKTED